MGKAGRDVGRLHKVRFIQLRNLFRHISQHILDVKFGGNLVGTDDEVDDIELDSVHRKEENGKACQSNHQKAGSDTNCFLGVSKKSGTVALLLGLVELLKDCLIQSGKVGRREGAFLVFSFCVTGKRVLAAGQTGKGICLPADVLDSVLPEKKLFKLLVDQMKVVIQRVL